jgi:hypothetical protein
MLLVYFAMCLSLVDSSKIRLPESLETDDKLRSCVSSIFKKYFEFIDVTYVDMQYDDNHILSTIYSKHLIPLTNRQPYINVTTFNGAYLILAKSVPVFVNKFLGVVRQSKWNPRVRFLLIIESFDMQEIRNVFDQFLMHHVVNVHVLDGSTLELYTYNPFEEYGCGRRYDQVVYNGECVKEVINELYPPKFTSGLRNCSFNVVASSNWPPYSVDLESQNNGVEQTKGIEQFLVESFSELEHFNINYIYIDGDHYSMVSANMSASGSLGRLQNNEAVMHIGGMLLSSKRIDAFDSIYSHVIYDDAIVFYLMLLCMFNVSDKIGFALKLMDALFLHAFKIPRNYGIRMFCLTWFWFGYLMNTYYQSYMTSLSVYPLREYQVSTEEDLDSHNFKRCISDSMQTMLIDASAANFYHHEALNDKCSSMMDSIATVSRTNEVYTTTLLSAYIYHQYELGNNSENLYEFKKPLFNLIYGIYLYKGFPLLDKFHTYTLRLKENGVIDKYITDIFIMNSIRAKVYAQQERFSRFIIPWQVFMCGSGLALFVFILELINGNKHRVQCKIAR